MDFGRAEFEHIMELLGLMFVHKGDPDPSIAHVELASLKCSDGYLNVGELVKNYPAVRWALAGQLVELFKSDQDDNLPVHGVIGAPTSSTALAGDVAEILGVRHFVLDKDPVTGAISWHQDQENILPHERILRIEELITTNGSCKKGMAATIAGNPDWRQNWYPAVLTVVDRSDPRMGELRVEGDPVRCLHRYEISNFEPEHCPFCAVGSPAKKPKDFPELFFPNAYRG
jgi:hypothetical protein